VVYNNQIDLQTITRLIEDGIVDNIVISPGPGTPHLHSDVGVCLDLLRAAPNVPILGVCLGFQMLVVANGGKVVKAPEPVHGRLSSIQHTGHSLFTGIPSGLEYQVVRYHSLSVDQTTPLPESLEEIAWTLGTDHHAYGVAARSLEKCCTSSRPYSHSRGILMAVAHKELPYYGVQYHPESVGTTFGSELLCNFQALTQRHQNSQRVANRGTSRPNFDRILPKLPQALQQTVLPSSDRKSPTKQIVSGPFGLAYQQCDSLPTTNPRFVEWLFSSLVLDNDTFFGPRCSQDPKSQHHSDTFWLDSSCLDGRGRFSFMGGQGGALWRRITYRLANGSRLIVRNAQNDLVSCEKGVPFWEWLEGEMAGWAGCESGGAHDLMNVSNDLPFDFLGGFVGYFGYEIGYPQSRHTAPTPDAVLFFVDRFLVVDHQEGMVYAVALYTDEGGPTCSGAASRSEREEAEAWAALVVGHLQGLCCDNTDPPWLEGSTIIQTQQPGHADFVLREPEEAYIKNVNACMDALFAGDSYELCLTTELRREVGGRFDGWKLYKTLRSINPAPYAAWMAFGEEEDLVICCSSPERFLRGQSDGLLEAKPIKGTARRVLGDSPEAQSADKLAAQMLKSSEKDRAENLMIVDLLRNDLGKVCQVGTVHVPSLMEIESFATVHQLVSTVRGTLRPEMSMVNAIRAAFPGGSMTGSPKLRSMEILSDLEGGARGVYSGSLGYLSVSGRAFDLNIVIRTAVLHNGMVSIGAGGAIVVQSDAKDEYREMHLKAEALLRAVSLTESNI
jgi:para-aminobenzoate synthetase